MALRAGPLPYICPSRFFRAQYHRHGRRASADLLLPCHSTHDTVVYLPGYGGQSFGNRTADAWYYLCSTSGHYQQSHDSRNHAEVPWESPKLEKARLEQPKNWDVLAPDHNPHTLLGNSTVIETVKRFAPPGLKFLLLTCNPAKRALSTYRFRYFGKGEFRWRQDALRELERAGHGFSNLAHEQMTALPPQLTNGYPSPWFEPHPTC